MERWNNGIMKHGKMDNWKNGTVETLENGTMKNGNIETIGKNDHLEKRKHEKWNNENNLNKMEE